MTRRGAGCGRSVVRDDRRGLSTPSLPLAIALVLLVLVAVTGTAFSLGFVENPFAGPAEVTTEFNQSVVDEGEAIAVTVVEASSGDPVEGATVVPASESASLDSTPELTADADGRAVFALGDGEDAVGIDWRSTERDVTITFEVSPPGEDFVDDTANPAVTVLRN